MDEDNHSRNEEGDHIDYNRNNFFYELRNAQNTKLNTNQIRSIFSSLCSSSDGELRLDLVGYHFGNGQAASGSRRWGVTAVQYTLGQRTSTLSAIEYKIIHQISIHIQRLGAHTSRSALYVIFIDIGYILLQRLYLQIDERRLAHLAESESNVLAGHLNKAGIT